MPIIYRLNTKIRLTMLCLIGFELYSRWVSLKTFNKDVITLHKKKEKKYNNIQKESPYI